MRAVTFPLWYSNPTQPAGIAALNYRICLTLLGGLNVIQAICMSQCIYYRLSGTNCILTCMVVTEHCDKYLYLCNTGTGKCWYQYRILDYSNTNTGTTPFTQLL